MLNIRKRNILAIFCCYECLFISTTLDRLDFLNIVELGKIFFIKLHQFFKNSLKLISIIGYEFSISEAISLVENVVVRLWIKHDALNLRISFFNFVLYQEREVTKSEWDMLTDHNPVIIGTINDLSYILSDRILVLANLTDLIFSNIKACQHTSLFHKLNLLIMYNIWVALRVKCHQVVIRLELWDLWGAKVIFID